MRELGLSSALHFVLLQWFLHMALKNNNKRENKRVLLGRSFLSGEGCYRHSRFATLIAKALPASQGLSKEEGPDLALRGVQTMGCTGVGKPSLSL